ncbi:MAG: hypothetical protein KDE28_16005, partial [Anaerolineales bacterium]|nr:hypothetical protein [Anaerolineales bacterium]
RVDLSAQTVLLADTSGQIIFSTGEPADIDLPTTMALLGGNMAAAAELKQRLNNPDNIHMAYFEGPPYDIYAASLNENFFATVLFDRRKMPSRIGLVWLYLRRALAEFADLLGQDSKLLLDRRVAEEIVANLDEELEALFGGDAADVAELLAGAQAAPVETPQLSNTGPLPQAEPKSPLHRKVRQLIGQLERQSNLKLHAHTEALDAPLNPRCGSMVLRLLGVGLKNIYQHSGATHVTINFEHDGALLRGNIIDNGVGFDLEQIPPFGSLADLQRHIIVNHGEFVVYSAPARGTTITFTLPV